MLLGFVIQTGCECLLDDMHGHWQLNVHVMLGLNESLLRNIHRQTFGPGLILWYNLSNERGAESFVFVFALQKSKD
jgi:hypothetical protein